MKTSGFSLIESTMAALLLATGLLSVSASIAATQRLSELGRRTTGAADVAASRLSALSVTACASPVSGSASGAYEERWSVAASGDLRIIALEVGFVHDHRPRSVRFDATVWCPAP